MDTRPATDADDPATADLAPLLADFRFVHVRCSPLQRARRSAQLAGLSVDAVDDDLQEWDYGGYEGLSTDQVRERLGYMWTVFQHGVVPGDSPGETVEEVSARSSRVLERVQPHLFQGDARSSGTATRFGCSQRSTCGRPPASPSTTLYAPQQAVSPAVFTSPTFVHLRAHLIPDIPRCLLQKPKQMGC